MVSQGEPGRLLMSRFRKHNRVPEDLERNAKRTLPTALPSFRRMIAFTYMRISASHNPNRNPYIYMHSGLCLGALLEIVKNVWVGCHQAARATRLDCPGIPLCSMGQAVNASPGRHAPMRRLGAGYGADVIPLLVGQ